MSDETVEMRPAADELVSELVEQNMGWAQAIARSVARAWNLDWQLDGLDGGAYEALLFCARRYNPTLGVPFRAYARKRIHEAATEEARKSKSWQRAVGTDSTAEQEAREISYRLFDVYPELREGYLPVDENSEDGLRSSVRQLLTSACVIAAFQESGYDNPEKALEYKRLFSALASLEAVHQFIIWAVYWEGESMRALAEEWQTDELTIIREHREILKFVQHRLANPRSRLKTKLKVRPSLRAAAQQIKKKSVAAPFARFASVAVTLLLYSSTAQSLLEAIWKV